MTLCNGKSETVWVKIGPIQPFADFNPPRPKWRKRIADDGIYTGDKLNLTFVILPVVML